MSPVPVGAAELEQALQASEVIAERVGEGRAAFDSSEDRRLALVFLWVNVGSALKQFCRRRGIEIEQGSSVFPGRIRMRDRLCYQRLGAVSARA